MAINRKAMFWLDGKIYVVPPKCGHTSIQNAKGVQRIHSLEEAAEIGADYDEIILVTRHPEDRLESAWRNRFSHLTWEEFVDSVLDTPEETADFHIKSQDWYMGGVTPDRTMTVAEVAERNPKANIGWLNRSDREQFTIQPYRKGEIMTKYARDLEHFNSRRG